MLYPEPNKANKELARSMLEQEKDFCSDLATSWDNVASIWDMLHFPISRINVKGGSQYIWCGPSFLLRSTQMNTLPRSFLGKPQNGEEMGLDLHRGDCKPHF
jgi:hypothetical protein